MKLFTTSQIRQLDQFTIDHEPIASIDLMERAADRILQQFKKDHTLNRDILILAGPGNNGGDGLALGRMLLQAGYDVRVILLHTGNLSPDCRQNKERLTELFPDFFTEHINHFSPATLSGNTLIVDALFGSGLSRDPDGIFAEAIGWINESGKTVVAIDIPSGLPGDGCAKPNQTAVKTHLTYTLQFPKLAFLFAENEKYIGKWQVIDISLHPRGIAETESDVIFVEKMDIQKMLKIRPRFSHKGTFGHALIWAGCKGMAGAAVLASKAAWTKTGLFSSQLFRRHFL